MTLPAPAVTLAGIGKRFGAVTALQEVDLHLEPGTVHALLGENGAGKSTLMGILFGLLRPDRGTVQIAGCDAHFRSPADAIRSGIGMVQQHFSHVPALTVAENVALGRRGTFHPKRALRRVQALAAAAGLSIDPRARVRDLSVGSQQRLEILQALARDARILILDEPTAVLPPSEAMELLRWVRHFAAAGGSAVLVTHKVREALTAADRVTVLRGGRSVTTGPAGTFSPATLAAAMFPQATFESPVHEAVRTIGSVAVAVRHATFSGPAGRLAVVDASFELRQGEIVGIAAVEGSGHETLLRALAGLCGPVQGEVHLPASVSFVPGDRQRDALVLDFPLFENLALHGAGAARGVMSWPMIRQRTREVLARFDVRADSERSSARALSGGNQQRFVLGRELESRPALLVAEHPTRGLDLVATRAIHSHLRAAAGEGAVVVVHSGDLDELLELSDRVLVVHAARVRELPVVREIVARGMVGD